MKLGNIIIDGEYLNNSKITSLDVDILNLLEDKPNNQLPSLIIGWNKTKKLYSGKASILNKTIDTKTFWTFNPKEKIQDFNEDIDKFIELLTTDFVKNINYTLIDPIVFNVNNINKLSEIIGDNIDVTYVVDDMIYYLKNNIIFGMDISVIEFIGINKKEVFWYLENNSKKIIFEDYAQNSYIYKYNKIFDIDSVRKYLPYIIYKDNEVLLENYEK